MQQLAPPAELESQCTALPKMEQRARRAADKLKVIEVRSACCPSWWQVCFQQETAGAARGLVAGL